MRADLKGICEAKIKELGERLNEEFKTMSAMSSVFGWKRIVT